MFDHAGITAAYNAMCPNARVMPPIDMAPAAGDIRFYERTAHIQDSGRRFSVACDLRYAMRAAMENTIMGGDVWFKPILTEA